MFVGLDAKVTAIKEQNDRRDEADADRETRLRAVESRQHRVSGAYALAAAILSIVGIRILPGH